MAKIAMYEYLGVDKKREGSLYDNAPVAQALRKAGHEVFMIPSHTLLKRFMKQVGEIDVFVLNAAHANERAEKCDLCHHTYADILMFGESETEFDSVGHRCRFVKLKNLRYHLATFGKPILYSPETLADIEKAVTKAAETNRNRIIWGNAGRLITALDSLRPKEPKGIESRHKARQARQAAAGRASRWVLAAQHLPQRETAEQLGSRLRIRRALTLRAKPPVTGARRVCGEYRIRWVPSPQS